MKSRTQLEEELSIAIAFALASDIASRGYASLLVSGGSTPRALFKKLSTININWEKVTILLVDDRYLEQNHKDQNGTLIKAHLLQNRAIKAAFIPMVFDHVNPHKNLTRVRQEVAKIKRPFTAVVLGMGTDGHTASLFPDADQLDAGMDLNNTEDIIITNSKSAPYERLSFTRRALLNAKNMFLHIYGEEKKKIFDQAKENETYRPYPIAAFINQNAVELELFWAN